MKEEILKLVNILQNCSSLILSELGPGWSEDVYQEAMEVALRKCGITYESQRLLPITFDDHVIGEGKPDLIVWLKQGSKRLALVIDLKAEQGVKGEHKAQVERYIKELKKQLRKNEEVLPFGLVINFAKESNHTLEKDHYEQLGGVQFLKVRC